MRNPEGAREGTPEETAALRLRDKDLWILHPGQRFDEELQGAEGVRLWEEAVDAAQTVADGVSNGPGSIQASPAITQLIWDASARAEEALASVASRTSATPGRGYTDSGPLPLRSSNA